MESHPLDPLAGPALTRRRRVDLITTLGDRRVVRDRRRAFMLNHFTYTRCNSLTYGSDLVDNWVPNSPPHQLYVDATNAAWIVQVRF
jgi:hypothetical protein